VGGSVMPCGDALLLAKAMVVVAVWGPEGSSSA
jgi:hypothetical protein